MSLFRPRANRVIVLIFFILCCLLVLTGRLPHDHPARTRINSALSYDLRKPWKNNDLLDTEDVALKAEASHNHHVGHPVVIGLDPATAHRYRDDGFIDVNAHGPHPIYELVLRAEKEWKAKNEKSSKSLRDAVAEYRRRHARAPPVGFDRWWAYASKHMVQLPDEYDRISEDLEPFWGIDPAVLRSTQAAREQEKGTFTIVNVKGKVTLAGQTIDKSDKVAYEKAMERVRGQLEMLQAVQEFLPDFRATFNADDAPSQFVPYETRKLAVEAAANHKIVTSNTKVSFKSRGWATSCPPSTRLPKRPQPRALWSRTKTKSFIVDHDIAMDLCLNPINIHLNGFLQSHPANPSKHLVPTFSTCTTSLHSDILTVPTKDWAEDVLGDPQWTAKLHSKVYWRGRSTGTYHSSSNFWNLTQRARFIGAMNTADDDVWVLPSTENRYAAVGMGERTEQGLLNSEWVDAKFVGKPVQCEKGPGGGCEGLRTAFGFIEPEPSDYEKHWKFLMDIDGNGCSSRFKRLMTTRGLVLKSTIHPEWYSDRIQPWLHYVPIKYDFTDLYDIIAFFKGDVDGQGGKGHDEMAATIGAAGRKWSLTFWRKEDRIAYVYRLFLEYARVMSLDRDRMDFVG